jgi:peroxiredoxin family protein
MTDFKMKKVGIVIASNDPETCWVAIRYAAFHLMEQKNVKIYFVDSGLKYQDMCDEKYDVAEIVKSFIQSGGQVYMCDDRSNLKTYLMEHFSLYLNKKDIADISDHDGFQSIMTKDVYVRVFKRVL